MAPVLPLPGLPAGASGRDYLVAAQQAIKGGDLGKAQAALERAETRILNGEQLNKGRRDHPAVVGIERALRDLGNHDRTKALRTVNGLLTDRTR